MNEKIVFKKGTHQLNRDPNYNFQLNRVINWDGGELADIEPIADKITDSASWKKETIHLGDKAIEEGRMRCAIAYCRMAEFFMYDTDDDKLKYYRPAIKLFYEYCEDYFASGRVERLSVPYEGVTLPVMHSKAEGIRKDIILLHGVLREQGKRFTHEWERPVKAVLDTLELNDVTIIGGSLGGMLAPRAAAFEKRIQRVIGWSIFPNFLSVGLYAVPKPFWGIMKWAIRHDRGLIINAKLKRMMRQVPTLDWAFRHGMYAYGAKTPFEYLKKLDKFQMVDVGGRITQDVLVVGARRDQFIPLELYKQELDALTDVRSLTFRLFTEHESGTRAPRSSALSLPLRNRLLSFRTR